MTDSPYAQIPVSQWATVTQDLLNTFPIKMDDLVKVVFSAWTDIFESAVGRKGYKIGQDILPQPQIMGFFLHELIPLNLEADYLLRWKGWSKYIGLALIDCANQLCNVQIAARFTGIYSR